MFWQDASAIEDENKPATAMSKTGTIVALFMCLFLSLMSDIPAARNTTLPENRSMRV